VKGDLRKFAELMAVHWEHKKKRSPGMSNGPIDSLYELARKNGALGGKIVGAGGGDFCCCIRSRNAGEGSDARGRFAGSAVGV